MNFPSSVNAIIAEAAAKHRDDIDAATSYAMGRIKRMSDFDDFVGGFVRHSIQEMIYDWRHKESTAIRRDAGEFGGPAKVKRGDSETLREITADQYMDYCIAGVSLGNVLGEQLDSIAASESAIASGHEFNATLCTRLRAMVPDGKRVRDAVSTRRLRLLFKELGGSKTNKAAA